MDGYQFLELYRRKRSVLGAIATAQDRESDPVMKLALAADGHVLRRIRIGWSAARVQAGWRRAEVADPKETPRRVGIFLPGRAIPPPPYAARWS
jgi:DNA-binding response OmpR family regulator